MKRALTFLVFLVSAATPGVLCAQGDFDPDAPPAETMKRLDQIHAGTPISSVPANISTPGHYYLTGNLEAVGLDAITITSSDVTLNLNGFVLRGSLAAVKVVGAAGAELNNVVISNGCMSISSPGVALVHACNCTLRDLTITSGITAISLEAPGGGQCSGNRIEQCVIFDNRGGIEIEATGGGSCDGNVLQSCIINGRASSATAPPLGILGTGGNCDGNGVRDCVIGPISSAFAGIRLDARSGGRCGGTTVTRSTISQCGLGIRATVNPNGTMEGSRIDGCAVHDFGDAHGIFFTGTGGICRGNHVVDSCVSKCALFGIYFSTASDDENGGNTVTGCNVSDALSEGIVFVNSERGKIANNHVTSVEDPAGGATGDGISTELSTDRVFVFNNTAADMVVPFQLSAAGTNGPVVTASGTLSSAGFPAHPWANFAR